MNLVNVSRVLSDAGIRWSLLTITCFRKLSCIFSTFVSLSVRVTEHDISARAKQENKNSKLNELVKLCFKEKARDKDNTEAKVFTLTL